ncbi:hypothetical protein FOC4_g10007287 [Fusarium odoratissimum]|uniref:Uncharacterized protein n=7 Tax=Fusarium oxysporum species complex TaxID=171631 RepID=N1RFY0_FUSC4|nr:hypothetical protein FOC4_g10007287 [Fusarium odoratissimum]
MLKAPNFRDSAPELIPFERYEPLDPGLSVRADQGAGIDRRPGIRLVRERSEDASALFLGCASQGWKPRAKEVDNSLGQRRND